MMIGTMINMKHKRIDVTTSRYDMDEKLRKRRTMAGPILSNAGTGESIGDSNVQGRPWLKASKMSRQRRGRDRVC